MGTANGGTSGVPAPEPEQPTELVRRWTSAVVDSTHIPLSRGEVRRLLAGFADTLAAAVLADPESGADVGSQVGHDMVAAFISSPEALGSTVDVLGKHLLSNAGIEHNADNRLRVTELSGQLCTGFVYALRDRLFAEQEMIKQAVIRAREESEKALATAEARLQVLFTTTAIGIGVGDLEGNVVNANPALTRMLGYALHELRQHRVQDLLYHEDKPQLYPKLVELRDGRREEFSTLARFVNHEGEPLWTYVSFSLIRDDAGRPQYPVAMVENRSYTHLLQDELQRQSVHDSLTGLANQKKFQSQLETVFANARPDDRVALFYWDLDGFKVVNDGLGRNVGDKLLRLVAHKLRAAFEPHDGLVARVAGDGFAVLLKRSPGRIEASELAQQALDDLAEPDYTITDNDKDGVAVSASVGIAEAAVGDTTADDLIRTAEITLHRAKANGKAQWLLAESDSDMADRSRFRLGAVMPGALETGEFAVHYQPALWLHNGAVADVRAIPFWEHPDLGTLHPREFIDLAEETGVVVSLGRWLINRVGQQAATWRDQLGDGAPVLCVWLAARMVHDQHLVREMNQALDEYQFDPSRLQINVPAVVVQDEHDDAVETLRALAGNGFRLGIDGVGAGGVPLATLHDIALRDVTMNSALVDSLVAGHDSGANTFPQGVGGTISIAHLIGCTVTAGGLDTPERVERIRALGVDVGFGDALAPLGREVDVETLRGRAGSE